MKMTEVMIGNWPNRLEIERDVQIARKTIYFRLTCTFISLGKVMLIMLLMIPDVAV
jgi:hypothetical protein